MSYRWIVPLIFIALSAGCSSSSSTPSRDDCLAVRAHGVDLQLGAASSGKVADAELAKHRRVRVDNDKEGYVDRCLTNQTADSLDCAMNAESLDRYHSCL